VNTPTIPAAGADKEVDLTAHRLLESAPDGILVVDPEGKIVLVNSQTERIFGHVRAELVGQRVEKIIPTWFEAQPPGQLGDAPRVRRPRPMAAGIELYGVRSDGGDFPIEITLSAVETAEGVLLSAAIRDVTERHKTEDARLRLADLVDSSDDAIIGKSLDGIISSWNSGAQRLFGYSAEEVIGRSITLLIPAARFNEERDFLNQMRAGGRVEHYDTVRQCKDGHEVDVSVTISPVRDRRGKLVGVSKVARDVTLRKRAEEGLARAKEAADASNRELEAFSYSVAHDLRAPLRGMSGFAEVLLAQYRDKLDADGIDCLHEIRLNAQKMGALIDALLSLSRVTRSEVHRERVDLTAVARAAGVELAVAEPERRVELVVEEGLHADVDPQLAQRLVANLLANAWKFTGNLPAAHIEVSAAREDGATVFTVKDDGAGFDMAYAAKLFAPFQRLHTIREFPGTGIGLATAQRIVNRHGGRIWAEGAVGAGAAFHFTLAPSSIEGAS
jgi:PAS domain S-box-containing protein